MCCRMMRMMYCKKLRTPLRVSGRRFKLPTQSFCCRTRVDCMKAWASGSRLALCCMHWSSGRCQQQQHHHYFLKHAACNGSSYTNHCSCAALRTTAFSFELTVCISASVLPLHLNFQWHDIFSKQPVQSSITVLHTSHHDSLCGCVSVVQQSIV